MTQRRGGGVKSIIELIFFEIKIQRRRKMEEELKREKGTVERREEERLRKMKCVRKRKRKRGRKISYREREEENE